jgi:hypothetical protein
MKKYSKGIALGLIVFLMALLVVLSLGFVDVPLSVMYSLFISILFIVALVVIPRALERPKRRRR